MVNRARDQLFADAALTGHEHGRLVLGDFGDGAEDVEHLLTFGQNVVEAMLFANFIAQGAVFAPE